MLFEVSEDDLLDSIILLNRKLFAIIELSVNALSICEPFELFTILKEIARVQYLLGVSCCFDWLHCAKVASLLFFEAEHEDIALLFFLADLVLELIVFSLEVLELQGQRFDLLSAGLIIHLFGGFELLELLGEFIKLLFGNHRISFLLGLGIDWFLLRLALQCSDCFPQALDALLKLFLVLLRLLQLLLEVNYLLILLHDLLRKFLLLAIAVSILFLLLQLLKKTDLGSQFLDILLLFLDYVLEIIDLVSFQILLLVSHLLDFLF